MMVEQARSWVKENATLVYFLIATDARADECACLYRKLEG